MEKEILAGIGIVITLIGYAAYIASILRGNTKPHPFSWMIWASLTAIAFFAQLSDGAGAGAWITGTTALISFIIVILAYLKNGKQQITKSDWIVFLAGLTAIPLWIITQTPLWSVILITVIDNSGFYSTVRKSWIKPFEELPFHYFTAGAKFILSLLALENFTIITVLYPLSLVISNFLFLAMLYYRRWMLKNV